MIAPYCSLDECKAEIKASNTSEDDSLMRHILQVSRRIDRVMGGRAGRPVFGPYSEARKFRLDNRHVFSYDNTLLLRGAPPLLAITSAIAGTTTITSALEGYPQGEPFFRRVRITSDGDPWYSYDDGDDPGYLALTGVWGYHSDYANAWLNVGVLAAALTAGATSLSITDVDGDDAYGFANKISRGHLLKIDSEYLIVTATDTALNTATFVRGAHGTTAAAHDNAATIYRWEVEEPIRRLTARQAGELYNRRGAYREAAEAYPKDLLDELENVLSEYMNS